MMSVVLEKHVKIVNVLPVCIFIFCLAFICMSCGCGILLSILHAAALHYNIFTYLFVS